MKPLCVPLVLAAAVVVTGCGGSGSSSSGSNAAPAASATCAQQFKSWQNGPAKAVAKQIVPALKSVQAAGSSQDFPALTAGLKASGTIAQQLKAYPMPACADPAGYWPQMLSYLKAAGDNAGSSSGLSGLLLAMAPLSKIPAVQAKLQAELAKNAGLHGKVFG